MEAIIYEDTAVIVLHKPGGVPVQTKRLGEKDIVSLLKNYRAEKKEAPYIGLVHRLDQPVEGVLVFAKTKEAAAALGRQQQDGQMDKFYRAIVHQPAEQKLTQGSGGELKDYLWKDGRTNTSQVVSAGRSGAKKAVLRYGVLRADAEFAELLIRLWTGRHHQIRVQTANAGMPIAGDRRYGRTKEKEREAFFQMPALCAVKIGFLHPIDLQKMEFEIKPENPAFQLLQDYPETCFSPAFFHG